MSFFQQLNRHRAGTCIVLLFVSSVLGGCRRTASDRPIGKTVSIPVPLGLPPLKIPKDNPPTAETIALGRMLFYDKHLSQGNLLSCASCHMPELSFTDGRPVSSGFGGVAGVRNAPTILNAAYMPLQFWDGRAKTLEEQVLGPIENPVEMNSTHKVSVAKLNADPAYKEPFLKAFGPGGVTIERVQNALASFERTLLTGNSAFDRYQYGGDKAALTPQQIRGLQVFINPGAGNCAVCHTIDSKYALFTDGQFHNTGEGAGDEGKFADEGRFHETKAQGDLGSFKTPTLRNVALTAPYMHDGSLKTLKAVVDFYAGGGNSNPNLDPQMRAIKLSGQDRLDLIEFLRALNGDVPANAGPPPGR